MPHCSAPGAIRFEYRTNSDVVLGIASPRPRLSWVVDQATAGWTQTGYEVEVRRDGGRHRTREECPVQTFSIGGHDQVLVPWPAPSLVSRERAWIRVRVTDGNSWSDWSEVAAVEASLLRASDWTARFISPTLIGGLDAPAPTLVGTLTVPAPVHTARLYVSAHGIHQTSINGRSLDDSTLAPGWTSYEHRLRYHTHDVTHLVQEGLNDVEALLGNGWWRGRLGWSGQRAIYGDRLALLAQLEVTTVDGDTLVLATDSTWQAYESDVVSNDLYDGQCTDLRRRAGSPDRAAAGRPVPHTGCELVPGDLEHLVAADGPSIRPTQLLPATRIWTSPTGRTLVDFGQNAVGRIKLQVRDLPSGHEVSVRHAEVLEDGDLATRPLRSAKATDTWIMAGDGPETLEPLLTFHGFRYAEVIGVPDLEKGDLHVVVVGSDMDRIGWFDSSHELLNQFHDNVVWSTRGNFIDLPMDCPQRDERLGWTGDVQIFAPTATFLYDVSGFLNSWLSDLAAEQLPDGSLPQVVPDVVRTSISTIPAAAWGDAATVVPWTLYQRTGDAAVLERQFPSMRGWVDKVADLAGPDRLWAGGFQYGDWLDPTAPPEDPFRAKADPDVVATAHLARSAQIVADAAVVLGRNDEAVKFATLASQTRTAFAEAYVTPRGRVLSDAPTVYALALVWNLLPQERQRVEAGQRLADLVRTNAYRISTGFVGTPLICEALQMAGHLQVAHRLLLQTECPSWLFPVTMGATTMWERWDSMRPDGSINPGEMTSFNHYALGAVADWMHRSVAGLAPASPGYRRILVRPHPPGELTHAEVRHRTPYGQARVWWRRAGKTFELEVDVPVGSQAEVHVPGLDAPVLVEHGHHRWKVPHPLAAERPLEGSKSYGVASVRDLLDHSVAWPAVVAAVLARGLVQRGEVEAAERLAPYLNAPVHLTVRALAPEDRFPGADPARNELTALLNDHFREATTGSGILP